MRKTTGADRRRIFLLVLLASLAPGIASAGQQHRKPIPYALIAGTVFREDGLSLPGARLVLEREGEARRDRRFRKQEAISDARGEFAFRVPPEPSQYRLTASAPGFESQHRQVQIQGEERIDVFFRLTRASKQ
ncbi:MAG: carboxypeptidase-like regulatory domain-containing protein [Bryobacterales bacterium]|nr:carboxypeptidase-like regulatory domain-containing protein [Bryobacteraceae bacterium]MDW8130459.1 carboxypeptidase-like regulatory domain-containing protein [Bryobacterales bacterium]